MLQTKNLLKVKSHTYIHVEESSDIVCYRGFASIDQEMEKEIAIESFMRAGRNASNDAKSALQNHD